jgi:hypothetical protein
MTALWAALVSLAVGYLLGRCRPAQRVSDWANWQVISHADRRGVRWWLVWLVCSAENIGWLATHPVQGVHAWRHRNDPLPKRGPAPAIGRNRTRREPPL